MRRPERQDGCVFSVICCLVHVPLRSVRRRCVADVLGTTSQECFTDASHGVGHMVSIGYLPRLRGAFACSGGIILASVKAFLRWDVSNGALSGPRLTDGRRNDHTSPFEGDE